MNKIYYYCVWWVSIACLPTWKYPHDHWVQSFDDIESAQAFYNKAQHCAKTGNPMVVRGESMACTIDSVYLDSLQLPDFQK